MNTEIGATQFDIKQGAFSGIIKIVGVGGCGGNAVNNMFASQAIDGVSYLLINTDQQDLDKSPVSHKLTIGPNVTKGEGAGDDPTRSIAAAEESKEAIIASMTEGNTKMVFVIAGLGGGTGTGAGPLVCKYARDAGLLVVGVVTLPWAHEGQKKRLKAIEALSKVKKDVDALLIINNEKVAEYYSHEPESVSHRKADEAILDSVKSISDMVVRPGQVNVDFADVRRTLKNGGIAIIKSGYATGENRIEKAVEDALNMPIMNAFDVTQATKILVQITSSPENELTAGERKSLSEHLTGQIKNEFDFIPGYTLDERLEEGQIKISILATGYDFMDSQEQELRNLSELSLQADRERRKELEAKEEQLYGEEIRRLRPHDRSYFRLNIEDLENEALLRSLADMPTYKRKESDYAKLEKIRERTSPPKAEAQRGLRSTQTQGDSIAHKGDTVISGFDH